MSERHLRQERLPQIGVDGQTKLARARVAIVGVGATGSHLAAMLGRAGVGRRGESGAPDGLLRLIDRDIVELSNLPRQTLFTQRDVDDVRPKALAAAEALSAIDPELNVEPVVGDLTADRAEELLGNVDLVLDGTDNFPTRLLVNDLCVRDRRPFIYCGAVGLEGQLLVVTPGGPCLRCYVPELPPPGSLPTCETAGVLGSVVAQVTSLVATEAVKLLLGADALRAGEVFVIDGWRGETRHLKLPRDPACPCCGAGEHPYLTEAPAAEATQLCGKDAVQLPASGARVDLDEAAQRLASLGDVHLSRFLLRLDTPERRVLLFADGRVVMGGTRDPAEARSLRARLLGD
ncbi:MAG: molybdopterin biosynthesis protein MoeB [Planctomycetota bacterium]|nr:MAG: molybdopterin biosynthesis protein MoeB [Planctomycetota bacterium]